MGIILIIGICVLTFIIVKLIDKYVPAKMRVLVSVVLALINVFIIYLIYSSVMKPIEFEKEKDARYEIAVQKLTDLKVAQEGYKKLNGKFADKFSELVTFVETAKFPIISRKDTIRIDAERNRAFGITTDATGKGGFFVDVVLIDTLGYETVKEKLFPDNDRYKRLEQVKIGEIVVPVVLKTGVINRNDQSISVFRATLDKNALLADLDQDLVKEEQKVESIDEINGDQIILGSLEEASTTGNWPKKYGKND